MAKTITTQWSQLDPTTQEDLEKLQKASLVQEKADVHILKQVHVLDQYPTRPKNTNTDEEKAEDKLAKRIPKQWSHLDPTTH